MHIFILSNLHLLQTKGDLAACKNQNDKSSVFDQITLIIKKHSNNHVLRGSLDDKNKP